MLQYGSQSDWEFMNTAVKEYTEIFYAFIIIIILKALSQTFDLLSDKLDCLECIALEINTFIFRHIMYACFSLSHVNSQNMSRIFSKIFLLMTLDAEILPHICHFFHQQSFCINFVSKKLQICAQSWISPHYRLFLHRLYLQRQRKIWSLSDQN